MALTTGGAAGIYSMDTVRQTMSVRRSTPLHENGGIAAKQSHFIDERLSGSERMFSSGARDGTKNGWTLSDFGTVMHCRVSEKALRSYRNGATQGYHFSTEKALDLAEAAAISHAAKNGHKAAHNDRAAAARGRRRGAWHEMTACKQLRSRYRGACTASVKRRCQLMAEIFIFLFFTILFLYFFYYNILF